MYPYEMAGWGSADRYPAYTSAALGDSVMAMRIRDGLSALAYLRTRPEVDGERTVVTGRGVGGIVALHVAAIDRRVRGIVVWDSLVSSRSLLEADSYVWPADVFVPNVLPHHDLPELISALPCDVAVLNPLDGAGNPLSAQSLEALNEKTAKRVFIPNADRHTIVASVESLLA